MCVHYTTLMMKCDHCFWKWRWDKNQSVQIALKGLGRKGTELIHLKSCRKDYISSLILDDASRWRKKDDCMILLPFILQLRISSERSQHLNVLTGFTVNFENNVKVGFFPRAEVECTLIKYIKQIIQENHGSSSRYKDTLFCSSFSYKPYSSGMQKGNNQV